MVRAREGGREGGGEGGRVGGLMRAGGVSTHESHGHAVWRKFQTSLTGMKKIALGPSGLSAFGPSALGPREFGGGRRGTAAWDTRARTHPKETPRATQHVA